MIYYSKIDAWIAVLLVCAAVGLLAAGILPAVLQHDYRGLTPIGIMLVVAFTLMWPLYYEITDAELIVRSGWVRWRIPLESILRVRPSNAAWSSPALSLDRLEVLYEKKGVWKKILVSPKDKENFLLDLRAHVPQLQPASDGLTRRGAYVPM
jgi:hypothetical protein